MYCQHCGNKIDENGSFCANCGKEITANIQSKSTTPSLSELNEKPELERSPTIAILCSLFICGLGQMYNNQIVKGLILLLTGSIGLCFGIIPGLLIWIYSMYDAHKVANETQ